MRDKNYNTCKFSEVIIHLSVLRRLRSRDTELMLKHSRRESRQVIRRTSPVWSRALTSWRK